MQEILTIHDSDIFPDKKDLDTHDFATRRAARAVVLDESGRVALIHAATYSYHKLPGGGVEGDEDLLAALNRELLEEIGCEAEVIQEIGITIEFRNETKLHHISNCYLTRKIGTQRLPEFTEEEIERGFEILWVDSIESAIALLEDDVPENYAGHFIQKRDLAILKAAQPLI